MSFCYKFPAVRGIQAGREYYTAMVPLKMLEKIFPAEDEFVLPEYRAQRRLNEMRIPEIKNYILKNRDSYVFSALAASIDGGYTFKPYNESDIGILEIDMDSKFLINDGQHRKAAIKAALSEDEELGNETISVVLYGDRGLVRSQQMFTDLNKHAVKTSNSISELYDSRDPLAVSTRNLISRIDFLDKYVDKEKDNLGKYSSSLFTLNTFYNANKRILQRKECNEAFNLFLYEFWLNVVKYMEPWQALENREISKVELREQYIATQAVIIQSLGRIGAYYYEENTADLNIKLQKLADIDWKRNVKMWKSRVIKSNGRIINNSNAIILAANLIKKHLDIALDEFEKEIEERFKNSL